MTEATKNINAEKIQGNLTVSSVSATTTIVTANFQMTSGATNGYVLTSDALGNARWAASTGGSGGTSTDTYVTGFTYNDANKLTISQNGGQSNLDVFINTMTGLTVNGNVLVNGYISANTIYNVNGSSILYNITASTIYTDWIDFNTNATVPQSEGRVSWDSGTGTLNIAVGDATTGLIDLQVGQEEIVRVFNSEIDTLTKGTIVYVSGNNGNRPSVKRAIATNDGYSVTTLGVVAADINSGAEGYVTTFGIISNLNTLGLTGGTPIWLSPYSAGTYTEIKPQAPQHTVLIGYVVRISATVGSIFVNISNGWELDELHDVRISGATNNQVLSYDSSQSLWYNRTLPNFITGFTDTFVTGGTFSSGTLTLNSQSNSVTITDMAPSELAIIGNGITVTGTTNTLSQSLFIPANSRAANQVGTLTARAAKTGNAGTIQLRLYWNTGATLTNAILVGTTTANAASSVYSQMSRYIPIEVANGTGNGTRIFTPTTFAASDFGVSTAAISTLPINWTADGYFLCAIQNGSALDSSVCNALSFN